MQLYEVTNGYVGDGYTHVLVLAEDEEQARRLASEKFKAESDSRVADFGESHAYKSDYWEKLEAERLAEVANPWASDVRN